MPTSRPGKTYTVSQKVWMIPCGRGETRLAVAMTAKRKFAEASE